MLEKNQIEQNTLQKKTNQELYDILFHQHLNSNLKVA